MRFEVLAVWFHDCQRSQYFSDLAVGFRGYGDLSVVFLLPAKVEGSLDRPAQFLALRSRQNFVVCAMRRYIRVGKTTGAVFQMRCTAFCAVFLDGLPKV